MTKKTNFKKHLLATTTSVIALGALSSMAPSAANAATAALTAASAAATTTDWTYASSTPLTWSIAGTISNGTGNFNVITLTSGAVLTVGNGVQAAIVANTVGATAGNLGITANAIGALTVAAAATVTTANAGASSHAISYTAGSSGLLTNSGTISNTAAAATNRAINVAAATTVAGITNTSTGTIQSTSTATYVIETGAAAVLTGGITNAGTIRNTDTNLSAINFAANTTTGSSTTNLINNTGLIAGNGTGNALVMAAVTGTITNAANATISSGASTNGVIDVNGIVTGAISNAGTITTGAAGIALDLGANVTLGVTNTATGSITVTTGTALNVSASTISAITNNALGIIQSAGGKAVNVVNGATITSLSNSGSIQDTGTGVGVTIADGGNITTLTNIGTISANTTTGKGVVFAGTHAASNVANSGVISTPTGVAVTVTTSLTGSNANGTIYNTGTIYSSTGGSAGVVTIAGALINSNTITAAGLGAGLYNAKLINDAGAGIAILQSVDGGATHITNSSAGTISTTGAGTAISVTGANTGTIYNAGSITTTSGTGLLVTAKALANLTNAGQIASTAGTGINLTNSAASAITVLTNSGTIKDTTTGTAINFAGAAAASALTNNGTISSGTGKAISFTNASTLAGVVSVSNSGSITSANTSGGVISVGDGSAATGTITNNAAGTISGTGAGGSAIHFVGTSSKLGAITNAGTIRANHTTTASTTASYGTGTAIDASASTTAAGLDLTNTGTIYGDIKTVTTQTSTINLNTVNTLATVATSGLVGNIVVAGTTTNSAINFNQGASASQYYGGTITGAAGLGAVTASTGNTYLTSTTASTSTSTGGLAINTLSVTSGAGLYLASATAGGSVALNARARVAGTVTVNGTLSIGAYNSVTAVGASSFGAASTLKIGVIGSTAGTYGTLTTSDTTATSGATIQIDPTSIGYIATGTVLDKVITSTASTTNFTPATLTETTESYIYSFASSADADTHSVDVTVTRANTLTGAGATVSTNSSAVGAALETIGLGGNAALDTVVGTLNSGASASAIEAQLKTLDATNSTSGQTTQAVIAVSDAAVGTVEKHMDVAMNESNGVATGGKSANNGVWGEVFGSAIDQAERKGVAGYQANVGGFAVGADTLVNSQTRVGAAFAYGNTDATGTRNKTKVNSYQGSVYGSYDMGKVYYEGVGTFAYNAYDTSRTLFDGSVASAAFNGQQYSAKATAGYKLDVQGGLKVTPFVSAQYSFLTQDSYSETGSNANLNVKSDDINIFKPGLGAKLAYPITDAGVTYTPRLSAAWYYDLVGDEASTTSNFTSAAATTFASKGADIAQSEFKLGAGLDVLAQDNVTVSLDYSWNSKESYNAHTGELKARFEF